MIGAFVAHVALKLPSLRAGLAARRERLPGSTPSAATHTLPGAYAGLSRRGLLAAVAAASGVLGLTWAGESVGGW